MFRFGPQLGAKEQRRQRLRAAARAVDLPVPLRVRRGGVAARAGGHADAADARGRGGDRADGDGLLPAGPRGRARVRNDTDATVRVLMFSTRNEVVGRGLSRQRQGRHLHGQQGRRRDGAQDERRRLLRRRDGLRRSQSGPRRRRLESPASESPGAASGRLAVGGAPDRAACGASGAQGRGRSRERLGRRDRARSRPSRESRTPAGAVAQQPRGRALSLRGVLPSRGMKTMGALAHGSRARPRVRRPSLAGAAAASGPCYRPASAGDAACAGLIEPC